MIQVLQFIVLIFPTNTPAFDLPETSSELLDKLTARLAFSSIVPQARPALSPPDTSTWTSLLRVISRSTFALFGSYTYSKADSKEFDISKFSGMKMALACSSQDTADSAAVGSVFGLLTNSTDSAKISITGTANDTITSNFNVTVRAGFYGGIVGRYSANALSSELALSDITVNVTGSCNALDFGGLIGKIGDNSKAYVSVKNTTISINNPTSSQNNYGGLVGYADQAFIDVGGKVTITANNVSANQSVGGIVGKFNKNGVVRLGGETNLSGFYPKGPNKTDVR